MNDRSHLPTVADVPPELRGLLEGLLAEVPQVMPATGPVDRQGARDRECVFYGLENDATQDTVPSEFSAIRFSVGRYRLVAPLNMLDGVTRLEAPATPLVGQAPWHRGMGRCRGHTVTLVDPGPLLGLTDAPPIADADHVLLLPDGRHGLLSAATPQPMQLSSTALRWVKPEDRRTWLAAVLAEDLSVLVDVEVFLDRLYARNPSS